MPDCDNRDGVAVALETVIDRAHNRGCVDDCQNQI
jgi:hypothetical protein